MMEGGRMGEGQGQRPGRATANADASPALCSMVLVWADVWGRNAAESSGQWTVVLWAAGLDGVLPWPW